MNDNNRLFVSVDMDEWYQCRWATGSANSLWPDVRICWRDIYGSEIPIGEIKEPTDKILSLFDSLNFKSTFFFTGMIASYYPDLVKKIAAEGHEIACHNYHHLDYEAQTREKFLSDLNNSKHLLEDISGTNIIGYRSPNSSIPNTLVEDLESLGFKYDSSITPTRRIFGKFGSFIKSPRKPYHPSYDDIGREGRSTLWEFPWVVFPGLKLPSGSGITHRIMGNLYNRIATKNSLQKGHASYYFHPYEIHFSKPLIEATKGRIKIKLFLLRTGGNYYRSLKKYLESYKQKLVSGNTLLQLCEAEVDSSAK